MNVSLFGVVTLPHHRHQHMITIKSLLAHHHDPSRSLKLHRHKHFSLTSEKTNCTQSGSGCFTDINNDDEMMKPPFHWYLTTQFIVQHTDQINHPANCKHHLKTTTQHKTSLKLHHHNQHFTFTASDII